MMVNSSTNTFTDKKNVIYGEVFRQGCTGSNHACVTKSIDRQISNLCSHQDAPSTPLFDYYKTCTWRQVKVPITTQDLHCQINWLAQQLASSLRISPVITSGMTGLWSCYVLKLINSKSKYLVSGTQTL